MGILEGEYRKRKKRQDVQQIVLATVSIAGLLALAAVAPNAVQTLKLFGFDPKKRQKEIMVKARDRLIEKRLLERNKDGFVRITAKGKQRLNDLELKNLKIKKPERWDGKWRVLIFDIPEKMRVVRNKIRLSLLNIGFLMLQNSVWIYPYDCEDYASLLKADSKIGKKLLYLIVDSLEYDKNYRTAFGLPQKLNF